MAGVFRTYPSKRARTTTILINYEDYEYMKSHGYKATNLLRKKIQELKARNGDDTDYKKAAEIFRKKLEKVCGRAAELLNPEEFKILLKE